MGFRQSILSKLWNYIWENEIHFGSKYYQSESKIYFGSKSDFWWKLPFWAKRIKKLIWIKTSILDQILMDQNLNFESKLQFRINQNIFLKNICELFESVVYPKLSLTPCRSFLSVGLGKSSVVFSPRGPWCKARRSK